MRPERPAAASRPMARVDADEDSEPELFDDLEPLSLADELDLLSAMDQNEAVWTVTREVLLRRLRADSTDHNALIFEPLRQAAKGNADGRRVAWAVVLLVWLDEPMAASVHGAVRELARNVGGQGQAFVLHCADLRLERRGRQVVLGLILRMLLDEHVDPKLVRTALGVMPPMLSRISEEFLEYENVDLATEEWLTSLESLKARLGDRLMDNIVSVTKKNKTLAKEMKKSVVELRHWVAAKIFEAETIRKGNFVTQTFFEEARERDVDAEFIRESLRAMSAMIGLIHLEPLSVAGAEEWMLALRRSLREEALTRFERIEADDPELAEELRLLLADFEQKLEAKIAEAERVKVESSLWSNELGELSSDDSSRSHRQYGDIDDEPGVR